MNVACTFGWQPRSTSRLWKKIVHDTIPRRKAAALQAQARAELLAEVQAIATEVAEAIFRADAAHRARVKEARSELRGHRLLAIARVRMTDDPYRILRDVERAHGIPLEHLLSRRKERKMAHARTELYWRLYTETVLSVSEIGRLLDRDHTTILKGVQTHMKRCGITSIPAFRSDSWRFHLGRPIKKLETSPSQHPKAIASRKRRARKRMEAERRAKRSAQARQRALERAAAIRNELRGNAL